MMCTLGAARQGLGQRTGLVREVQAVRVHGRHQELGGGRPRDSPEASAAAADVVAHERLGEDDVAVGVEAADQLVGLVVQVAFHLVAAAPGQRSGLRAGASDSCGVRPNRHVQFGLGAVGDVRDPAGEAQPGFGVRAAVVVAAVEVRDPAGWPGSGPAQRRSVRRCCWRRPKSRRSAGPARGTSTAHSRARAPPIEPPSTACQLPMPRASARRASARMESRIVTNGNRDPQRAPVRCRGGRSGGAVAAAQDVGRHDEVPVRVDGGPGTDQLVPPAGFRRWRRGPHGCRRSGRARSGRRWRHPRSGSPTSRRRGPPPAAGPRIRAAGHRSGGTGRSRPAGQCRGSAGDGLPATESGRLVGFTTAGDGNRQLTT